MSHSTPFPWPSHDSGGPPPKGFENALSNTDLETCNMHFALVQSLSIVKVNVLRSLELTNSKNCSNKSHRKDSRDELVASGSKSKSCDVYMPIGVLHISTFVTYNCVSDAKNPICCIVKVRGACMGKVE